MATFRLRTKRIYDEPAKGDGLRVLADRLWPRGVAKADAQVDLWAKELTPSHDLRKWLHEDPERYDQFVAKYTAELNDHSDQVRQFLSEYGDRTVTLLTAVKDLSHSHIAILQAYLERAADDSA
ncbi:DUF488 family protein [Blastopirellula sp. JC732]|uniref:DUF488 family protein n=1 Tax=Blastopirellula sediminis TaxID=2894196 RepID=A0A9X1SIT2_9BACT|nr:DUF488 family protein [Blastopirellula sediminis]MCC9605564.1 DUF488 family protein [Blastopirellula sediminis]MCC9631136.1 DUF488 family protein [Blastopirellula sediminis]